MTVNSDIRDGVIRHSIWLERYKAGLAKRVVDLLNQTEADLIGRIMHRMAEIDKRGFDIGTATTKRLNTLLRDVRAQRKQVFAEIQNLASDELKSLSEYEADFQSGLIKNAAAPIIDLDIVAPARAQLHAAVTSQPFRGHLLSEWYSGLATKDADSIVAAIRIGIVEGQTTDEIVRRIRGTRDQAGILEITRRDADSIVRTAVSHVSARAHEAVYQANADIMIGLQFVATLDGKTTPKCRELDGRIYSVEDAPRIPLHFRCRSVLVPYLGETDIKGTRASQFGPVPEDVTYEKWLKSQSHDVQDDILGKSKAKLFREGGLPLDRFVDNSGREYTLQQLRMRDRDVFDSVFAGGDAANPASQRVLEADMKEYLGEKSYNRMKDGVAKAMEVSGVSDYGLTEAEKVAVHAYTSGERYFVRLNEALRSDDAAAIARVAPLSRVLDKALEKLPVYNGAVLFRVTDLPQSARSKIVTGEIYSDAAFMSASKVDLGKSFGNEYRFTIYESVQGREISGFSAFTREQEILFPRGSKFDIIKASPDDKTGFIEVLLRDKDD